MYYGILRVLKSIKDINEAVRKGRTEGRKEGIKGLRKNGRKGSKEGGSKRRKQRMIGT